MSRTKKLTAVSLMHYAKLTGRSLLFLTAAAVYIINRINNTGMLFGGMENNSAILFIIAGIYIIEMILRFFPSRFESPGCQKQFKSKFKSTGSNTPQLQSNMLTLAIGVGWLALNAVFGVLYYTHVIDAGILILISLAFSVCDMICILFFCPFQTWFMKNKCCTTCRIYNWDYAMMFTPLVFTDSLFYRSILVCAVVLLIRWEITYKLHPERFSEATNKCLSCAECSERLCHHKKQLKTFLNENKSKLHLMGNTDIDNVKVNIY